MASVQRSLFDGPDAAPLVRIEGLNRALSNIPGPVPGLHLCIFRGPDT